MNFVKYLATTLLIITNTFFVLAQRNPNHPIQRSCGSIAPDAQWENWFQNKITETQNSGILNQRSVINIPVVVHVIHDGSAIGTSPNLSQARIQSQIDVLNEDYGATNADLSNLPSEFSAIASGDVGIRFCLALTDPNNITLTEPGIDRIDATQQPFGWAGAGYSSQAIDTSIKPATIWDPTKYFNIWVTPISSGLLGYATFPPASGLTGISSGGTSTTDGVVIHTNYFGRNNGTTAPYNLGRTCTHETGHWLGLRHIWGDAACGDDYCTDTPPQNTSNFNCPTHPVNVGSCAGNTNGDMFMNFMDYVDDACMYVLTADQKTRIITAMANSPHRNALNNAAVTACGIAMAPVANFITEKFNIVKDEPVSFYDQSSGNITSWYWQFSGTTTPSSTLQNPTVSFSDTGYQNISLIVSDGTDSDTIVKNAYVYVYDPYNTPCNYTTNFNNTDTVKANLVSNDYISGNNSYNDIAKAEKFSYDKLVGRKINSATILFYKNLNGLGTNGSNGNNFTVQLLSSNGNGLPGNVLATVTKPVYEILNVNPLNSYPQIGDPNYNCSCVNIYPFTVNFPTPVTATGDVFLNIVLPNGGDTVVIYHTSNLQQNINTAFEQWSDSSWHSFDEQTSWGVKTALAIKLNTCPDITCTTAYHSTGVSFCEGDSIQLPGGQIISQPGSYNDTLVTAFGCDSVITYNVSFQPGSILVGQAYLNGLPIDSSMAIILKKNEGQAYPEVETKFFNNGQFVFNTLISDSFIVAVKPNQRLYPNAVLTFSGDKFKWENATRYKKGCNDTIYVTLNLLSIDTNLQGTASITGFVYDISDTSQQRRPGEPIRGIDIILEDVPGGNVSMRTTTQNDGSYNFNDIPSATYKVYVLVPGCAHLATYTLDLNSGTDIVFDKNFYVDSVEGYIDTTSVVNINDCPFMAEFNVNNRCAGQEAHIKNNSITPNIARIGFRWDFNNDGIVDDTTKGSFYKYIPNPAILDVKLVLFDYQNNCKDSIIKTIPFVQSPTTFAGDDINACVGETVTLSAVGADNFVWFDSVNVSNPLINNPTLNTMIPYEKDIIVRGVKNNICFKTDTIHVIVNSLPIVSLTSVDDTMCTNGSTVTLTGSPTGGYYGGTNVNTTSGIIDPLGMNEGLNNYEYQYIDENGCFNSAAIQIYSMLCTGIKDQSKVGFNYIFVNNVFKTEQNNASIKVYNSLGQETINKTNSNNADLNSLGNGVYIIKVVNNNMAEFFTRVIVK